MKPPPVPMPGTDGGGIYFYASGAVTETVRNCTISGNTAGISGGGISEAVGPGSLTLVVQNSTIAGNVSDVRATIPTTPRARRGMPRIVVRAECSTQALWYRDSSLQCEPKRSDAAVADFAVAHPKGARRAHTSAQR